MTNKERFERVLNFQNPGDRLPVYEWAPWWDKTVERWKTEGLDPDMSFVDIINYFGHDARASALVAPINDFAVWAKYRGGPIIKNEADYEKFLPNLYSQQWIDSLLDS